MTGCGCLPCGRGPPPNGPVTLNVGGVRYTTSRSTLSQCAKLKELTAGPLGPDGAYFLDRDGRVFSEVLNFLRDGPDLFTPPSEVDARRSLQREAAFFGLPALADCVEQVYTGAPIPTNEESRLDRLQGLSIMHTDEHEQHFDAITRVLAAVLDVPIALISLVGENEQWFKSRVGLEANSTSRNTSFCAFTFTPEGNNVAKMFVIEDAKTDPRVAQNPLVLGPPYIKFYAGCPLITSDGMRLGALCAIDRVPRSISPLQAQFLVNLAQICVAEIQRAELTVTDIEDDFEHLPTDDDFAAGPLRGELLGEAIRESLCIVEVRSDTPSWPVIYGNQVWADVTGFKVIPPERFPGRSRTEPVSTRGADRSISAEDRLKEMGFLDWVHLQGKTHQQLLQEIKFNWQQPEPMAFALKGVMEGYRTSLSTQKEAISVMCRFSPAELPLDGAAAAIRPVPQRESGSAVANISNVQGRLYFVYTVKAAVMNPTPAPPPSRQVTLTSPGSGALTQQSSFQEPSKASLASSTASGTCGSDGPSRKGKGNTVESVAAIKPPRSPFDDVRLRKLVGQGSFGKVYYGLWMGSPVAVKTIEAKSSEQCKFEPAFEAVLSASMAHPNLVQTFMSSSRKKPQEGDLEESDILETWMVQEWCDRGTLGAHCSRPRADAESAVEVVDIAIDIAAAGSYLHSRGIIHGDLTANNVLIRTQVSRKGFICKVCDFGLARVLEGDTQDIMTTQLGTVTHMPPELFAIGQEVRLTAMADVYAAGVLYWQTVKGEAPFSGLSPPQVVVQIVKGVRLKMPSEVMPEIVEVYNRCTSPTPTERPTFDELVQTFSSILQTLTMGPVS